jgi:cold shock CspA family protein
MKGKLDKIFLNHGYAFIVGEDGERYFLHLSELLHKGDVLEFTPVGGPKGNQKRAANARMV